MPRRQQGRLFKRKNTFYLQLNVNGKRRTRVIKDNLGNSVTREDIAKKYRDDTAQKIRESLSHRAKSVDLKDFVKHWEKYLATYRKRCGKKHPEAEKSTGISPTHFSKVRSIIEKFVLFMQQNYPAIKAIQEVKAVHAEHYMAEIAGSIKDSTYNRYLMALRQAFNVVPETRDDNPFSGIVARTMQDERDGAASHRRFTDEELLIMDEKAEGWVRPAMFISYYTGFRLGDVVTLKFSEVDDQGFVLHTERKTSKAEEIYAPAILSYLEDWKPKRILDYNLRFINNSQWMADHYGVGRATAHALLKKYGELKPVSLEDWRNQLYELASKAYDDGHTSLKKAASRPWDVQIKTLPDQLGDYVFPRMADAYLGITRKKDPTLPSKEFQRFLTKVCGFNTKDENGQTILSFHSLRATYATISHLAGQAVEEVQDKLRHTNSGTTERYVQPTRDEARKQLMAAYQQLPYPGQSSNENKDVGTDDETLSADSEDEDIEAKLNELLGAMPEEKRASIIEKWSTQQESGETEA